jgi:hypothetical protein
MYVPHLPEKNMQVCALAWQAAEKRAEASSEAIWDVSTTRFLHKSLSLASPRTCFFRSLFKPLPDRPPWSVTFGRFGDHARVFLE